MHCYTTCQVPYTYFLIRSSNNPMLYYHNFAVKETKDHKYFAKYYNIGKERNWDEPSQSDFRVHDLYLFGIFNKLRGNIRMRLGFVHY